MSPPARNPVIAAGLLGFTGVALGAFGAHALKDSLLAGGMTATWHTAVFYQLIHAVALLAFPGWKWVGRCWTVGVVLFSGSLYWLALGGPKFLGSITPLGGLALLAGWALLAWHAFRQPKE